MFAAGKTSGGGGAAPTIDAQFNYVTMLLHGDGTNGAQNNTFLDSSGNSLSLTRNGNATQGSFSPYGSNWSNFFDGTSYLSLATATALGTGNVTVELWFYPTDISATYQNLYEGRSAAATNTGLGVFQYGQTIEIYGNGLKVSSAASAFTVNTWTHFAVVRTSGTCQIYINGVASGSSASYSDNFTSTTRRIGTNAANANAYTGYISNLREVTSALYSGTFTPSTTPLTAVSGTTLFTCQSNRFIDNSSNAYAITISGTPSVQRFNPFGTATAYSTAVIGGSGYFDGTGDYVSTPSTSNLTFGSGAFTIEAWVYANALGSFAGIFSQWPDNGATANNSYTLESVGSIMYFYWVDSSPALYRPANLGSIETGVWTHFAICRSGSTLYPFKNGVLGTTTSITQTLNSPSSNVNIGGAVAGSGMWNGYISNLRVLKGTALYTSNFTPPTAPVIAITNTSLLTDFTNAGIFDNAMMNDLETVGNAQISTSVYKYGTGSMYFDGTGDYLFTRTTPDLVLGTGDFTVEFWINLAANLVSFAKIIQMGTTGDAFTIETQSTTNVLTVTNFTSTVYIASSTALTNNTWIHVAATRASGTLRLFQDGTSVASAANTVNFTNSGNGIYIGSSSLGTAMNGYIDDLRITKGYARYTANFTPPTAAFPNTGPV